MTECSHHDVPISYIEGQFDGTHGQFILSLVHMVETVVNVYKTNGISAGNVKKIDCMKLIS